MKNKTKKRIFLFVILSLLLCITCYILITNKKPEKLSQTKIDRLRETYPNCARNISPLVDFIPNLLESFIEDADSFVYGEFLDDFSTYTKNSSLLSSESDYYEYSISVISDSEGKYTQGEHITLSAKVKDKDYFVKLSKGMKVVVPVIKDKEVLTRHTYIPLGMFYVTEDGYALSVFEGYADRNRTLNGVKVEKLLEAVKK